MKRTLLFGSLCLLILLAGGCSGNVTKSTCEVDGLIETTIWKNGDLVAIEYRDAKGKLALCEDGYAEQKFIHEGPYNSILEICYYDTRGHLTIAHSEGYARMRVEDGDTVTTYFYDTDGNLINSAQGMAIICEVGRLCTSKRYFDKDGQPVNDINGISEFEGTYTDSTRILSFYDSNHHLAVSPAEGYAQSVCTFSDSMHTQCYYDSNHQLIVPSSYGYAKEVTRYDADGNHLSDTYYDADGNQIER